MVFFVTAKSNRCTAWLVTEFAMKGGCSCIIDLCVVLASLSLSFGSFEAHYLIGKEGKGKGFHTLFCHRG